MPAPAYNIGVAGFGSDTSAKTVPQLFAAETPPAVTTDIQFPAGAVGQFVPLTTGFAPWDPAPSTGSPGPILALTAYAVPGGTRAAVYHAGCFNLDAINWPTGTTEALIQAATENTQLKFRKLLYSQKSKTPRPAPGTPAGP